jgi:UDP-N-acetylmuramoylalanine--D-glutamate ligase
MPDHRNLVLGLGKTGVSVVRWLTARGESVTVNDSRSEPPGTEALREYGDAVRCNFGGFQESLLGDVNRIIVSPGISRSESIIRAAFGRGIPVIGDIELFASVVAAPVVAVTGTNGKSTVTTLVAEMIRSAGYRVYAGGNLGEPALDLLDRPTPDFYMLELSSYQLESTSGLTTAAAVVLNVSPDHMDRYSDLNDYAAAKSKIYGKSTVAVVNADDPIVVKMDINSAKRVSFGLIDTDADYTVRDEWVVHHNERIIRVADIRLPGLHNVANALAALALGSAIGLPRNAMTSVLRTFSGLPHRMQVVAEHHGVRYVDDSKGTNVGATVAAVEGLSEPVVLVAGGDGKGQDFAPLQAAFKGRVKHAILIGRDKEILARSISSVCAVEFAEDMDSAVLAASRAAKSGDIVLLSPACASLDMYKDYAERGNRFAIAAQRLSA